MKEQLMRTVNKIGLKIKKYSPEIFMVAGIAGTVTSAVLACRATLKVNDILEEKNELVGKVHDTLESEHPEYKTEDGEICEYTQETAKKDLTAIYAQTGVKLAKIYIPAIGLGTLSIASIVMGNRILNKRNAALIAAYAAVDKGFKNYRKNVVERFGEQVDRELRYNIKAKEVEKTIIDKNGKEKKVKETVLEIGDPNSNISEYARFFDEWNSDAHTKDPEYNLMFLRRQQDYANEKLKANTHLFLNEVYDMLGIPRTKAGQMVGWIYDEKNPNGDNYVDFGIYDLNGTAKQNERKMAFVNGQERNILLDFNVDGIIYDKI